MRNVGWTSSGSTYRESRWSTSDAQVSSAAGASRPCSPMAACSVARSRVAKRLARPGRREFELARVARVLGHERDERLAAARDVVVIRIGLVPLEHRELGVVLERHALVAE